MRFKIWMENQQNNRRRKSSLGNKHHNDHNHDKSGNVGKNPRYSGKRSDTYSPTPNRFRKKDQFPDDYEELR